MSNCNSNAAIVKRWYPLRNEMQWVLATIIEHAGSAYRKTGALMLINDRGEYFGLLSGGCLEIDLVRQAKRVFVNQHSQIVTYDSTDESDIFYHLGCGGSLKIALMEVSESNNYLCLKQSYELLQSDKAHEIALVIDNPGTNEKIHANIHTDNAINTNLKASTIKSTISVTPNFKLLIVGGGVDAQPVARIASELGWQIELCDNRASHAKDKDFIEVSLIHRTEINELYQLDYDGIVIMTHNISRDALALQYAIEKNINYIALLGPIHRKKQVFDAADIDFEQHKNKVFGPAGLDIGGDLPESIALSIIAQCHQVLHGKG